MSIWPELHNEVNYEWIIYMPKSSYRTQPIIDRWTEHYTELTFQVFLWLGLPLVLPGSSMAESSADCRLMDSNEGRLSGLGITKRQAVEDLIEAGAERLPAAFRADANQFDPAVIAESSSAVAAQIFAECAARLEG